MAAGPPGPDTAPPAPPLLYDMEGPPPGNAPVDTADALGCSCSARRPHNPFQTLLYTLARRLHCHPITLRSEVLLASYGLKEACGGSTNCSDQIQVLTCRMVGVAGSAPLPVRAADRASCTAFTAAYNVQTPTTLSAVISRPCLKSIEERARAGMQFSVCSYGLITAIS